MEQYRSEILFEKHCPTIYALTKKAKIDWKGLDYDFEANHLKLGIATEANIVGLLLHAESGEQFPIYFLRYCEFLAKNLQKISKEKRKFREILIGKITNFKDLNYLNPIGELAVLKKLTDYGYELIRIEDKICFPSAKPKDFLFRTPQNKEILIEVVNIHIKDDFQTLNNLKIFLFGKMKEKIEKETVGIDLSEANDKLFFQPVLWHVDLIKFKEFKDFFKEFSSTFGKSFELNYNILGFCTFGTIDKKDFIFGELSTFYDRYNI
ncbi:hypothetical protein [Prolixibacter sp. NT017]|uniref:hypothetical protein n=1 Tax=Prolixibacter sp. NT017 TaxID=2652390 RepID=UPI00126D47E3|nr:hypothetical protein [Prolixibacter sp. NT017]GET24150.1 hypothetical protein NT017_04790 [Prolixibacter sp. NT017]